MANPMSLALQVVMVSAATLSLLGQSLTPPESQAEAEIASDLNINSRYTVESIQFFDHRDYKLSTSSREEIRRLVGAKLSTQALDTLTARIQRELRAHQVTFKLTRGALQDSVRVLIQVDHAGASVDASIPALSYNSQLGFTGVGEISSAIGPNALTLRMVRSTDTLIEQYSGIQAGYQRSLTSSGRIRIGFEFDAYADGYDGATVAALENESAIRSSSLGAGAYSSRLNYEPSATFVLAAPLTYTVGFSFEQLNGLTPAGPWTARSESANALVNTLRYHQRWGNSNGPESESTQDLDAAYSLRAASATLASDLAYTRHLGRLQYNYSNRTQSVEVTMLAGAIYGQAPLFERFALGNSELLRGWNMYDLDPLGGNRLAYGSVTYGYRMMRVFFDTGSVWDQGKTPEIKESVGIGVSSGLGVLEKGAFLLALGFPLRQGPVIPVLIAGMNF
jgi:Omp85 superfamily domain